MSRQDVLGILILKGDLLKQLIVIFLLGISFVLQAQFDPEDNQWWVGLKAGVNRTQLQIGDRYSVLSFDDGALLEKDYNLKKKSGYQVGGIVAWDFYYNFNITAQPYFANHKYSYSNKANWESPENNLEILDFHLQSINFLNIPLLLRYEFRLPKKNGGSSFNTVNTYRPILTAHSKLTPYIQAGISYTRLLGANKNIQRVETINGFKSLEEEELLDISRLMNKGGLDYLLGGGVQYDIAGSFRIALDAVYKIGSQNLTNQKNRFSDNKLTLKYFDAPDDLKFNSWQVNIHFMFPLKFIYSPNYKSISS